MNTEFLITLIGKLVLSVVGCFGLLLSTEKIILDINILSIIVLIVSAIIFSYGLYSLIKDFPIIIHKLKGLFK